MLSPSKKRGHIKGISLWSAPKRIPSEMKRRKNTMKKFLAIVLTLALCLHAAFG